MNFLWATGSMSAKRWYQVAVVAFMNTAMLAHFAYSRHDVLGAVALASGTYSFIFTLFCIHRAQRKKIELEEEAWREKERKYEVELAKAQKAREARATFENWLEAHQTREKYSKLQQANEQQMIQRFGPRKISVKE